MTRAPAPRPCESCPYRRDVPAGLWSAHEYEKLPDYDNPTAEQPLAAFYCHQQNGRLCAGWLACHGLSGPYALLSLRLALHSYSVEDRELIYEYATDVPVFETGTEAAVHGLSGIEVPDEAARQMIDKILRLQGKRA